MDKLFSAVLNMSVTGSLVILPVLLVRLLLKRFPKIFSYALWSVVLFRLLCPLSLSAPVSFLNVLKPETRVAAPGTTVISFLPEDAPVFSEAPTQRVPAAQSPREPRHLDRETLIPGLWLSGVAVLGLSGLGQYLRLRKKLVGAVPLEQGIYWADYIDTPFVLGVFRPRIYLPSHIPAQELPYILAHERHHIRRCDHIWKLLAYCALCIHWFDPLVWVAFVLAGKDMEMSCDEAVIRQLGPQIRGDYSASLLRLASGKKRIAVTPLAFGQGDTKGRVLNMAKWKKPKVWVSLLCFLVCAAVLAACAVNPKEKGDAVDPGADTGIAADGDTLQYGSLTMTLPQGVEAENRENGLVLTQEGKTIGGIDRRDYPAFVASDLVGLKEAEVGCPLSYMSGSSPYGDTETEIFWDGNLDALNELHTFFIFGDHIYDVWFDLNQISSIRTEDFLKTVSIDGTPVATEPPGREAAMEQCQAVLNAIRSGSCHLLIQRSATGDRLRPWSVTNFYQDGENRLVLTEIAPESAAIAQEQQLPLKTGRMVVNGTVYTSQGGTWEQDGSRDTDIEMPWLASFQWDDSVTYQHTLTDETGTVVMLRIDKPYIDSPEYPSFYFLNFQFDPQGSFINIHLQNDLFGEHQLDIVESIVSLDQESAREAIEEEYGNVDR